RQLSGPTPAPARTAGPPGTLALGPTIVDASELRIRPPQPLLAIHEAAKGDPDVFGTPASLPPDAVVPAAEADDRPRSSERPDSLTEADLLVPAAPSVPPAALADLPLPQAISAPIPAAPIARGVADAAAASAPRAKARWLLVLALGVAVAFALHFVQVGG